VVLKEILDVVPVTILAKRARVATR